MGAVETGLLGLAFLLLFIFMHIPVGIAMALVGGGGYFLLTGDLSSMISLYGTETINILTSKDFSVVMFFLLMGGFAGVAGVSADIYRVANVWIGHWRGGLAMATILGCAGFGAIAGSSIATSATMAKIALPEMEKRYPLSLCAGTLAAGGTLGSLIPPSIIMVIYAVQVEQFVVDLFLAAVGPGLLTILLFLIAVRVQLALTKADKINESTTALPMKERVRETRRSWPALSIILIVMGGIYGGFLTVNEGAAVGLALTLLFALVKGGMNKQSFRETLLGAAGSISMLYMIVIGANIFGYFLTLSHMPMAVSEWITSLEIAPILVIFILVLVYILLGCVFDALAGMILTLPFVVPIVTGLGYDLVWWGIVMVMVIEVGMITPPVGINVFVIKGLREDIPLVEIFKGVMPFLIANIIALVLVILFPAIAIWLPNAIR